MAARRSAFGAPARITLIVFSGHAFVVSHSNLPGRKDTKMKATYYPAESAVFLKTNERFGGLSNMAPGFPIVLNGVRIRTSEALFQACRFPRRPDVQRQIIDDPSPMTAKMRSKPFRSDTRPDWDAVRGKILRWCLRRP